MRNMRGQRISMIFQEPMLSLNPVMTVAEQIGEVLQRHFGLRGQPRKSASWKYWIRWEYRTRHAA